MVGYPVHVSRANQDDTESFTSVSQLIKQNHKNGEIHFQLETEEFGLSFVICTWIFGSQVSSFINVNLRSRQRSEDEPQYYYEQLPTTIHVLQNDKLEIAVPQ